MLKTLGGLLMLLVMETQAVSASLQGAASVVDGDTIEIYGQRIRLHAFDALESRQME